VLNDERHAGARILVAGPNFGTGSSREHAVWAIQQYGFDAVVSPRFADIFRNNATKNGLVPAQVEASVGEALMSAVQAEPDLEITVDVARRRIEAPAAGIDAPFELSDAVQDRFLRGLDDIGLTLGHAEAIDAYEAARPDWLPTTT
jgi:3-isopropylmalate/(R)-2-methylmalate dehydratase small subunit